MTGVIRAVALLVALALPTLIGCEDDSPPPVPEADSACVAAADLDHADLTQGEAVWMRFCPVRRNAALVPDDVLTDGAQAVAEDWDVRRFGHQFGCGVILGTVDYRLQIGYADGTVAQIVGDTGCDNRSNAGQKVWDGPVLEPVLRAMGSQRGLGAGAVSDLACPADRHDPVNVDGIDPPAANGPLLERQAAMGILCTYPPRRTKLSTLDATEAEEVRLALAESFLPPDSRIRTHMSGPAPDPLLVGLIDNVGNVRWFGIAGQQLRVTLWRGAPGTPAYLGKAGDHLQSVIDQVD